jgi:hypothetical protein
MCCFLWVSVNNTCTHNIYIFVILHKLFHLECVEVFAFVLPIIMILMIRMKGESAGSSLLQEEQDWEGIHRCAFRLYLVLSIPLIWRKVENWKHLDLQKHLDFLASTYVDLCSVYEISIVASISYTLMLICNCQVEYLWCFPLRLWTLR